MLLFMDALSAYKKIFGVLTTTIPFEIFAHKKVINNSPLKVVLLLNSFDLEKQIDFYYDKNLHDGTPVAVQGKAISKWAQQIRQRIPQNIVMFGKCVPPHSNLAHNIDDYRNCGWWFDYYLLEEFKTRGIAFDGIGYEIDPAFLYATPKKD